jgi:hypothetical protein
MVEVPAERGAVVAPVAAVNGTHEIPPVLGKNGKPEWSTWTKGLLLPKLRQIGDIKTLTDFWIDNGEHIEAAKAALGDAWPEGDVRAAWQRLATPPA